MKLVSRMIGVVLSLGVLITLFAPSFITTTSAQSGTDDAKNIACEGVGIATGGNGCNPSGGPTVDSTIKLAINILSLIVGIAAVIMIIVGGFKYVISSGDSNNINSAKNTILYAIVGLVIVALAQIIVVFVLNKASPS